MKAVWLALPVRVGFGATELKPAVIVGTSLCLWSVANALRQPQTHWIAAPIELAPEPG
jgi:hypothetical protein